MVVEAQIRQKKVDNLILPNLMFKEHMSNILKTEDLLIKPFCVTKGFQILVFSPYENQNAEFHA